MKNESKNNNIPKTNGLISPNYQIRGDVSNRKIQTTGVRAKIRSSRNSLNKQRRSSISTPTSSTSETATGQELVFKTCSYPSSESKNSGNIISSPGFNKSLTHVTRNEFKLAPNQKFASTGCKLKLGFF